MTTQIADFETVIGLEVHVQLNTRSKIFCGDDTSFGSDPNTQISILSLAHPGTLPKLNREAIRKAVQLGLALGCEINRHTAFDRKNYFYADLPKGYQITQDREPICKGGAVEIKMPGGQKKTIRLHHIHLEEDAGKSIHDQSPRHSLIDLNRAGVPLLEIVSEPDLRSPEETTQFMETLQRLVRWLEVSDGNMEEGSLRCDVNISVRRIGEEKYGQRCEVKNVNSMRFARRAIDFEVGRQISILANGGKIQQETRGFDPATGQTFSQREKEDAHDYRYFPEPDLPPVRISEEFLEEIKTALPVLPQVLENAFFEKYQLSPADSEQLTTDRGTADFFQKILENASPDLAKPLANFIIQKIKPWADENGKSVSEIPLSTAQIIDYLQIIETGKISASTAAQRLFPILIEKTGVLPSDLAAELNLFQTSDTAFLEKIIVEVLEKYPEKVQEFRKGKKGLMGFFVGEAMKLSRGKADPKLTGELILKKLME